MKWLRLFLCGWGLVLGGAGAARAESYDERRGWWFGDPQYGLPLWPPARYWDPRGLPDPGPLHYWRQRHLFRHPVVEPPADLPPPRPLPPKPAGNQARLDITMPDPYGILYVNEEKTSTQGVLHHYLTGELPPGQTHLFNLRAAFRVGNELLIEEQKVAVRAGETLAVDFQGKNAQRVALPTAGPQAGK